MGITEKSSVFVAAQYGDFQDFNKRFRAEEIDNTEDNSSLLHYAIAGRNFDIALFLISNKINVNLPNIDGQTALHYICLYQDINVAKALLSAGANVDARDKYGNNPLWSSVYSCKGKNYEMVSLLMQYGSDPHTKNKLGKSPLDFATTIGNNKLIGILTGIND